MNEAEIRAKKINPLLTKSGWEIVDFKTDAFRSDEHLAKLTEEYTTK